jgi:hypothetical protein
MCIPASRCCDCVQASVSGKGTSGSSAANGSSGGSSNANNHVSVASDDDDDAFLTRAAHMAAQRKNSKR